MKTSKEEIVLTSLKMFAERGFDAVSTSMIAGELGITKGALYRHFENKQEIFDSIIEKMFDLDAERAKEDYVPVETFDENPEAYQNRSLADFCSFTRNQFTFWTMDTFASLFRRMITIEQYKSDEARKLYQDVIAMGPVNYTADLLEQMMKEGKLNEDAKKVGAKSLAVMLYAPLKLTIELADGGANHEELLTILDCATKEFESRWMKNE